MRTKITSLLFWLGWALVALVIGFVVFVYMTYTSI